MRMNNTYKNDLSRTLLLVFCMMMSLTSCSQSVESRDDMYELAWHDEFNGSKLDTTIWSYIPRMHMVRSFCGLTTDKRMLQFKDGRMRMYARYNNGFAPADTARYLTVGLWSCGRGTFTYGKIVVRARIHGAIGAWPAIWTMPEDRTTWDTRSSRYTEIDIMEYVDRNNFVYQTAHNAYTLKDKANWHKPEQQALPKIDREKYNEYCVEILPDVVIFSVNGKETHRYPKTKENEKSFMYGMPSHIRMNTQTYPPKGWATGLKPRTFPGWMDIDYVRVYKLK